MKVDAPVGIRHFTVGTLPIEPWRNGGGITRTLHHRQTDGRTAWRVSIADITRNGAFSTFPGLDRRSVLIDGQRVLLRGEQLAWALESVGSTAAYPGELELSAELQGDSARLFNCMVDRERASMTLEVGSGPRGTLPTDGDTTLIVLQGRVDICLDGEPLGRLEREQGLVVEDRRGTLSVACGSAPALWVLTTFRTR